MANSSSTRPFVSHKTSEVWNAICFRLTDWRLTLRSSVLTTPYADVRNLRTKNFPCRSATTISPIFPEIEAKNVFNLALATVKPPLGSTEF